MIARASEWTSGEVRAATSGTLFGSADRRLVGVATDTKGALSGHLFVALVGERFDAHDFLAQALDAGAGALLVGTGGRAPDDAALRKLAERAPVIRTADTLKALGDLARAHRARFAKTPIVGLTGSNGKTTTKEMIAAILGASRTVLKTEGNLNNQVGLPMTLLGLNGGHAAAVLEMGMNARGEIAYLEEIAAPDVALVTNVGPAHIGMLGSLQDIAEAKGELFRGAASRGATLVVNLDDPEVLRVARAARADHAAKSRMVGFGRAAEAEVRLLSAVPDGEGQRIRVSIDKVEIEAHLPFLGAHNALNACAAIAATTCIPGLSISDRDITAGLAGASRVARRLAFEALGPFMVVDDCYNANAASMIAALDTVKESARRNGGRLIALLGEMRELGEFAPAEHARVGEAAAAAGAAVVAAFGPLAAPIAERAAKAGVSAKHEASDPDALFNWLYGQLRAKDVILVKGSRGIQMERFIERLKKAVAG